MKIKGDCVCICVCLCVYIHKHNRDSNDTVINHSILRIVKFLKFYRRLKAL